MGSGFGGLNRPGGLYGGGLGMGGMGGMYGGGFGGGMYGGGFGNGMYGNQAGQPGAGMEFLNRMQMFVYQFCEIAQMVEYNSHGLMQFFAIIKKAYLYLITQGKEFIIWLYEGTREKLRSIRGVLVDYFVKSEEQLSKTELESQIEWI